MQIETREHNERYIITNEKHKGQDIVIKIGSTIKEDIVFIEGNEGDDSHATSIKWSLQHNSMYLYISLEMKYRLNNESIFVMQKINEDICVKELANMVKANTTLDSCPEIKKAMYLAYSELFKQCLSKDIVICSNNIVEGLVAVNNKNRTLGHATRFILNKKDMTVCEYAGQSIAGDMPLRFNIKIDNLRLHYVGFQSPYNEDANIYTKGENLGYFTYRSGIILRRENEEEKLIDYPRLNVSCDFTDKEKMIKYYKENNDHDLITSYKLVLRGKIEMIDVNEYMLNEFLV